MSDARDPCPLPRADRTAHARLRPLDRRRAARDFSAAAARGRALPHALPRRRPQALAAGLDGKLGALEGPNSLCVFLRDATLPGYSACVEQFGVLVFLQPLALGPWISGQDGIWVSPRGRMPPVGSWGVVPGRVDLKALDRRLETAATRDELREALGGRDYDEAIERSRRALADYLEDWSSVERASAAIRGALDAGDAAHRDAAKRLLGERGLTEKDLRAPWFHLSKERRDFARPLIAELARRLAAE